MWMTRLRSRSSFIRMSRGRKVPLLLAGRWLKTLNSGPSTHPGLIAEVASYWSVGSCCWVMQGDLLLSMNLSASVRQEGKDAAICGDSSHSARPDVGGDDHASTVAPAQRRIQSTAAWVSQEDQNDARHMVLSLHSGEHQQSSQPPDQEMSASVRAFNVSCHQLVWGVREQARRRHRCRKVH